MSSPTPTPNPPKKEKKGTKQFNCHRGTINSMQYRSVIKKQNGGTALSISSVFPWVPWDYFIPLLSHTECAIKNMQMVFYHILHTLYMTSCPICWIFSCELQFKSLLDLTKRWSTLVYKEIVNTCYEQILDTWITDNKIMIKDSDSRICQLKSRSLDY